MGERQSPFLRRKQSSAIRAAEATASSIHSAGWVSSPVWGQREHRQHGGIGGHAVARIIRDHAAQGQPALRQRNLGKLVAVLVRAGQIHPSPFGVQLLPLIPVRPMTAVSRNDKQRVLLFDQIQAFGLLGDVQLGEQREANVVIRIREFRIVRLGTHVQIQLVQIAARGQRLSGISME